MVPETGESQLSEKAYVLHSGSPYMLWFSLEPCNLLQAIYMLLDRLAKLKAVPRLHEELGLSACPLLVQEELVPKPD